jgi:hypothetical protein
VRPPVSRYRVGVSAPLPVAGGESLRYQRFAYGGLLKTLWLVWRYLCRRGTGVTLTLTRWAP